MLNWENFNVVLVKQLHTYGGLDQLARTVFSILLYSKFKSPSLKLNNSRKIKWLNNLGKNLVLHHMKAIIYVNLFLLLTSLWLYKLKLSTHINAMAVKKIIYIPQLPRVVMCALLFKIQCTSCLFQALINLPLGFLSLWSFFLPITII